MEKGIRKIHSIMRELFTLMHKIEGEILKTSEFSDLSRTEMCALSAIGAAKKSTMTQISIDLDISVSTLTVAANKLVKKEYIERLHDENDRRIVKIALTKKGEQAKKKYDADVGNVLKEAIKELPNEYVEEFTKNIENVNEYLRTKI